MISNSTRLGTTLARTLVLVASVVTLLVGCAESGGSGETATQVTAAKDVGASAAVVPDPALAAGADVMGEVEPIPCVGTEAMQVVCGFKNPEDLAVIPGGHHLLVSEMGAFMSDAPNTMSLLNLATNKREMIAFDWLPSNDRWGDPKCQAPNAARFSPHGIDLMTREDGRVQVLVVNHGDEQVEFFELTKPVETWRLTWRGCAKPGGDPFINDVAGLQDGGFVATHMWDKGTPFDEVVTRLSAGEKIGWVWEWQPNLGFTKLPNSVAMMPNGIAVSADNTKIFVNIYMANKTIKLDRKSGKVEGEFAVRSPDNVVVDDKGFLWVASHLNDPIEGRCAEDAPGPCLLPFQVVRADPETMAAAVVMQHDGEPMGYATVALPHNGRLYLGSAHGDRIASVTLN